MKWQNQNDIIDAVERDSLKMRVDFYLSSSQPRKRAHLQGIGRGQGLLIIWHAWSGYASGCYHLPAACVSVLWWCGHACQSVQQDDQHHCLFMGEKIKIKRGAEKIVVEGEHTHSQGWHQTAPHIAHQQTHQRPHYMHARLLVIPDPFLCPTTVLFSKAHCCSLKNFKSTND